PAARSLVRHPPAPAGCRRGGVHSATIRPAVPVVAWLPAGGAAVRAAGGQHLFRGADKGFWGKSQYIPNARRWEMALFSGQSERGPVRDVLASVRLCVEGGKPVMTNKGLFQPLVLAGTLAAGFTVVWAIVSIWTVEVGEHVIGPDRVTERL